MPPKKSHAPLSTQEVDDIYARIEEMTSTVHDVLNADLKQEAEFKKQRDEKRRQVRVEAEREKNYNRYNPSRYHRLEDDELIEKLLRQADEPEPPKYKQYADLTHVETVALREAERMKGEGNTHFKQGEWKEAYECYSTAVGLEPQDDELIVALHNNRAAMSLKLDNFKQAVEDASFVLQRQKHNQKALLRRATALCRLHKPTEALVDIRKVLNGDAKNVEAKALLRGATAEEKELTDYQSFAEKHQDVVSALGRVLNGGKSAIEECTAQFTAVGKVMVSVKKAEEQPTESPKSTGEAEEEKEIQNKEEEEEVEFEEKEVTKYQRFSKDTLERVSVVLCDIVATIGGGSDASVLLRLENFFPVVLSLIPFVAQEVAETDATSNPDPNALVFVASVFRVLAAGYTRPVACDLFETQHNDFFDPLLSVALDAAKARRPVSSAAAVELLGTLCQTGKARQWVISRLDQSDMNTLKHDSMLAGQSLRLLDKLLMETDGQAKFLFPEKGTKSGAVTGVAEVLAQINNTRLLPSQRDAAVSVLLRLSTAPKLMEEFCRKASMEQFVALMKQEFHVAVEKLNAAAAPSAASVPSEIGNEFLLEGLLASFYNVLRSSDTNRVLLAEVAAKELLHSRCVDYLRAFTKLVTLVPAAQEIVEYQVNVISRLTSLLAKVNGSNKDVQTFIKKSTNLSVFVQLLAHYGPQLDETGEFQYRSTVVENVSLLLAINTRDAEGVSAFRQALSEANCPPAKVLAIVGSVNPRTVGNVALVIPALFAEQLDATKTVSALLEAIKDLRSVVQQHLSIATANKEANPQLSAESAQIVREAEAAQKNCGIALSRLAKHEPMLVQLREQRGLEILAATVKLQ